MTVEFSEHQQDALMRLASDMHTSKVGVLRAAVSLLALVHREASTGGRFAVVQDGQPAKLIEIVGLLQIEMR